MGDRDLNIRRFKEPSSFVFDTMVSEYYDLVFEYNIKDNQIDFLHISEYFLENGISPETTPSFRELSESFSKNMVVDEEKEPFLDQITLPCILDEIKSKGNYVRTVHIHTPHGIQAESLRIKPLVDGSSRLLVCLTDISMILDRDWMTDEYSRSGFISRVEQLLKEPEYQEGYSVIYTNISGFKAINDILGTHNGDMVIFGTRSNILDELDPVLIARLESDHFAIFAKTENITEEKMHRFCHQSYMEGTKRLSYIIRCGVYKISDPTKKVSYMLDQAKLAEESIPLDQTIPFAICNQQMSQDYVNQRLFAAELDSALNNGEFVPYYQPIVDANTYEIVSAEALIRWIHPEKGLIPPNQFIPIFEKEGLTSRLARFMLDHILDFNSKRLDDGQHSIPCSVNLSRIDFYDTKLLDFLKDKFMHQANVSKMIKLEITESSYATLESGALEFLEEMQKLNLSILLDDFGRGMSSLSTLEFYDFDVIKLDMGFIRRIGQNEKSEALIRYTIALAHALGAKVVAEGVETKEQLEFLQSVDCDMIQGYYFYKPMPQEDFIKLL